MHPRIAGLPPVDWTAARSQAAYDQADSTLTLTAAAGVDWTNDPLGGEPNTLRRAKPWWSAW
ncbi:hypothetical protein [Arthrobacter sp. BE255]|uniref:hypothetical protein n=1 Tax=Arthrobacter sp. BE255 TaxID=2817721 RepID=UPI00285E9434|nr:hypothetical protein [Arthrobacter sp. BE255]MDR7159648.1 hypothetical protein [Arthrobacter sp. BE255]